MDRYIKQLLEDLAKAEANPIIDPDFGAMSYKEFEKTMLEIENSEKKAAKEIVNVSYEELPPVENLNHEQMEILIEAIIKALAAKGTSVYIPGENAPVELVYTEIRKLFKEGFNASSGWVQDFCDGCCPGCEFVDYCESWKETWTQEELEQERRKSKE